MLRLRSCLQLVSLAVAVAATSASRADLYVKAGGLYNQAGDIHLSNTSAFTASLKNNTGFSGSLGFKLWRVRLEGELQALRSGARAASNSTGALAVIGSLKETTGFANALLDLPSLFGIAPYLGAGLGYARVDLENFDATSGALPVTRLSGSGSVFGYQGMLGLQLHLFGRATINAGYRLVKREDLRVRDVLANARQSLSLGSNRLFELGVAIGF